MSRVLDVDSRWALTVNPPTQSSLLLLLLTVKANWPRLLYDLYFLAVVNSSSTITEKISQEHIRAFEPGLEEPGRTWRGSLNATICSLWLYLTLILLLVLVQASAVNGVKTYLANKADSDSDSGWACSFLDPDPRALLVALVTQLYQSDVWRSNRTTLF